MTFASICAMTCCCPHWMKVFPYNYMLLFTFTAFEGVLIGFVSAQYTWQSVILAAGMAMAIFFCLSVYAFWTKTDWTGYGPYLSGALMTLLVWGCVVSLLSMCGVKNLDWMIMLYNLAGLLIF